MGWIPDLPDARDYTWRHDAVLPLLQRLKRPRRSTPPDEVDLRGDGEAEYLTSPHDQGPLNCSAACAVLSLIEYFERRIRAHTFEGSKLFLYKVTRNRLRLTGNTGVDLRTTFKVLVQFGVPMEEFLPYDVEKLDDEPNPFLYGLAQPFPSLRYFRLDAPNSDGSSNWETLKTFLAAGFPVAFGFSVPSSLTSDAEIPYRPQFDRIRGGQAVVALGYQKDHFGRGQHGLLIRNSWGDQWGDGGNGWLPVAFVRKQLVRDFWTVVREEWLDSNELFRPAAIASA